MASQTQISILSLIYNKNIEVLPILDGSINSIWQHNFKVKCDKMTFQNYLDLRTTINFTKIKSSLQYKLEDQMRRFYFRPLLDFADPFFPFQRRLYNPSWRTKVRNWPTQKSELETQQKSDPHSIFDQFFKQNQYKTEAEKEFFKKHHPLKVEAYDPYKVLGLKKEATVEEVKEAYRSLALKNHPKNDPSPEAATRFAEVAKAYETIVDSKKSRNYEDFGFGSFFEDFQKEINNILGKPQQAKTVIQSSQMKPEEKSHSYGQLYSESSNYETVNGQQTKYIIEKKYKKDGKLLSVKREEKLKDDGNVEITETIDNGNQVKKKTYIQEKDVKKLGS